MHNENLKFINIGGWDMPAPYRNPTVRAILNKILEMAPGEMVRVDDVPPEDAFLVYSAVYRQVRRHGIGATVRVCKRQIYLKKNGGE